MTFKLKNKYVKIKKWENTHIKKINGDIFKFLQKLYIVVDEILWSVCNETKGRERNEHFEN
jgi:hypothetical protein